MDWNAAIERNREALKRILAMLVAMAALAGGGAILPRHLHRAVLRLLRPAEAAARRLVIVIARGLVVVLPPVRQRKPERKPAIARKAGARIPVPPENLPPPLPLLDPLRRWSGRARPTAGSVPRICVPGFGEPFRVRPPSPDDPVNAARLALRLEALGRALDDLGQGASPAGGHAATRRARKTGKAATRAGFAACGRCAPAGRPAGAGGPFMRCTRF